MKYEKQRSRQLWNTPPNLGNVRKRNTRRNKDVEMHDKNLGISADVSINETREKHVNRNARNTTWNLRHVNKRNTGINKEIEVHETQLGI